MEVNSSSVAMMHQQNVFGGANDSDQQRPRQLQHQQEQPTTAPRRPRKTLPPLAPSPSSPSASSASESADGPTVDTMVDAAVDAAADPAETKSEIEQLLRNHIRFARAFKLNDPALLLPFLDKDAKLTTTDGDVVEGASAVLARLVGVKMTKLSAALHVKGRPTRAGPWQSMFVYEHGLVFKEPLYSEVVAWKPQTSSIAAIIQTRLSNPHDAGPPKSVADVVKVVAALPHRLSLSDDDEVCGANGNSTRGTCSRRSSCSRTSVSSSSVVPAGTGVAVTSISVLTRLTPIRKRKLVNAFLTVETARGDTIWKSGIAKKQTMPLWNPVDLEIAGDIPEDEPVVLTLWDYGFFRSLRVASTQITASQLLKDEVEGDAHVQLKPMGLLTTPIELSVTVQRMDGEHGWSRRQASLSPSGSDVSDEDASDDSQTKVATKSRSIPWLDLGPNALGGVSLALVMLPLVVLLAVVLQWTCASPI